MSVVVLGGGLSGLSAAYYLLKKFPQKTITLIESSERTGGWIRSTRNSKGYTFEQGPRTIRPSGIQGINTLELIQDIGLENEIVAIPRNHPAALNRMIYANGSLNTLPSSLKSIFVKSPPFSKPLILHLLKDITTPKKHIPDHDESIYNFVNRRFGSEVADYLISPLICGICAGNAKQISVNFLMKSLFENEQKYGSITKGLIYNIFSRKQTPILNDLAKKAKQEKWSVYSFKKGIETLPKTLDDQLKENGIKINCNTKCMGININSNKILISTDKASTSIETDYLFSCVSAPVLGDLIIKQHPKLAALLKSIKSVNVAVINMYFDAKLIKNEGFGFLVAPKENLPILGVIYDSCCFPNESGTVLTVMMGGYWFEEKFGTNSTEDSLFQMALEQVQNILQFSNEPVDFKVNILRNCIPQYTVGHNKRVKDIENYIKTNNLPIVLCGSSYYGVGVNDVILSAKNGVNSLSSLFM